MRIHPPGGEEIFVLDGTFSGETGDFTAGTNIRNSPGFTHASFSRDGCVLFVKLHRFQADEVARIALDTQRGEWFLPASGSQAQRLHRHGEESVVLVKLAANGPVIAHDHPGGEKIYVLDEVLEDEVGTYLWA